MTSQQPVVGQAARTHESFWAIITHPAFRLGFLDARNGRGYDHDRITARILDETPAKALQRLSFCCGPVGSQSVEIAQYRYEEGRRVFVEFGLRCRGWGHPDHPPSEIRRFIDTRVAAANASARSELTT